MSPTRRGVACVPGVGKREGGKGEVQRCWEGYKGVYMGWGLARRWRGVQRVAGSDET